MFQGCSNLVGYGTAEWTYKGQYTLELEGH